MPAIWISLSLAVSGYSLTFNFFVVFMAAEDVRMMEKKKSWFSNINDHFKQMENRGGWTKTVQNFSCLRGRKEHFRQNFVLLGKFLKDWVLPVLWWRIIFTPCICTSLQHQEINSILCKTKDTSQSHGKALQCVIVYLWVLISAGAVPYSCGRETKIFSFHLILSSAVIRSRTN